MTPVGRWFRDRAEKFLDRFYEGPTAPGRYRDLANEFANQHPHATRGDWIDFAADHAAEAYRQGYIRGVEHVERDWEYEPIATPEQIADGLDPAWRESPPFTLTRDPGEEVRAAWTDAELTHDDLDEILRSRAVRRI